MSTPTRSPDAIVVGGGIIGCTLAYELQKREINTVLLEQGQIGREASWATAGIIGPPTAAALPPHRSDLAARSQKRYDDLLNAVSETSGLDTSYLNIGKLLIARTEQEVELAHSQINWQIQHGFEATWIEQDEVRELDPIIPDDVLGAYYTSDGGAVTGHRLTEAIAVAFKRIGGEIREHTPAVSLLVEGDRVTGVDTTNGPIHAGTVALAAGAWTRFLGPGIARSFPVTPYKGQMISVIPESATDRPQHVIGRITGGYIVPRIDGTVALGASLENLGFDRRVTAHGIEYATGLMTEVAPVLKNAGFSSAWAGLRPGTEDDTPIMGPVSGYDGLWICTGHHRTGIQLAPGSAELVANAIAGQTDELLSSFSLDRFAD